MTSKVTVGQAFVLREAPPPRQGNKQRKHFPTCFLRRRPLRSNYTQLSMNVTTPILSRHSHTSHAAVDSDPSPQLPDSERSEQSSTASSIADLSNSQSSASSFFTYPVSYAVSGIVRRLTSDSYIPPKPPAPANLSIGLHAGFDDVDRPAQRRASPFQPPPLNPLGLSGYDVDTRPSAKLLTTALAEEIRLLLPQRLQLLDRWELAYSLEQNGVSLSTLYDSCTKYRESRGGYVLVVRDSSGGASLDSGIEGLRC